jgi:hypothetical protein
MRYVIATLLGIVLGAACAAGALYYNPLTEVRELPPQESWTLSYDFPGGSTLALTHAGQLGLPHIPADVETLWEAAITDVVLNVLVLEDENGAPRAMASRISVPSQETDFLLRGFLVSEHWLVTIPGQGTLFVDGENNLWPFLKEAVIPVRYLWQEWGGPVRYPVTIGPTGGRTAEVVGVSGAFADVSGSALESYELRRFNAVFGIEALRGTLAVALREPAGADAVAAELSTEPGELATTTARQ